MMFEFFIQGCWENVDMRASCQSSVQMPIDSDCYPSLYPFIVCISFVVETHRARISLGFEPGEASFVSSFKCGKVL